jgi:Holliday junction resolvase-like predicted endonuclease
MRHSWHVATAAEAVVAAQFARCGWDISVQYGANQPEYDLVAVNGDRMLKVSVKGSKDGGWGLTQSYISNANDLRRIV